MPSTRSKPIARLLLPLLESYEASTAFRKDSAWARDMIVKLDERTFPEAFAPEGAELLQALFEAARSLESVGAVRVVYPRGIRREQPKEVRMGPAEVALAYVAARPFGVAPLSQVLQRIATHAAALRSDTLAPWMNDFLTGLAGRLLEGDGSCLGASRKRLKERADDIEDALRAAVWLSRAEGGMERIVSERIFGRSKRLVEVKSWVRSILQVADPHWVDAPPASVQSLLEHYGIRTKPIFLYCAGAFRYPTPSGGRNLADDIPSAAVPEGLATALGEGAARAGELTITTIENETPYHLYIEECGGPEGLAARREVVVYTAGYPGSAVVDFLCAAAQSPAIRFRHWGDADADGVQIWWMLRNRLGKEVRFFRTTSTWAAEAASRESRLLSSDECGKLERLRALLESCPDAHAPDIREGLCLLEVVLGARKWLEQERYYNPMNHGAEFIGRD